MIKVQKIIIDKTRKSNAADGILIQIHKSGKRTKYIYLSRTYTGSRNGRYFAYCSDKQTVRFTHHALEKIIRKCKLREAIIEDSTFEEWQESICECLTAEEIFEISEG